MKLYGAGSSAPCLLSVFCFCSTGPNAAVRVRAVGGPCGTGGSQQHPLQLLFPERELSAGSARPSLCCLSVQTVRPFVTAAGVSHFDQVVDAPS